ncbi:MAG: CaiB/BaiF CoA transferase family protein [Myxococcota bacterium]
MASALHEARRSGEGQFLDVALYDAVLSLCENLIYTYAMEGRVEGPRGEAHPWFSPYELYATRDGTVAIAALTPRQWETLCEAIGRPDLARDERSSDIPRRLANRPFVNRAISSWTTRQTTRQVIEQLGGRIPLGPVQSAADIFADPHVRARGMLVEVAQPGANPPIALAGPAIKLTRTPATLYRRAPKLGEHGAEILAEAGLTASEHSEG